MALVDVVLAILDQDSRRELRAFLLGPFFQSYGRVLYKHAFTVICYMHRVEELSRWLDERSLVLAPGSG
jgi:hypothetical protein